MTSEYTWITRIYNENLHVSVRLVTDFLVRYVNAKEYDKGLRDWLIISIES